MKNRRKKAEYFRKVQLRAANGGASSEETLQVDFQHNFPFGAVSGMALDCEKKAQQNR